MRRCVDVFVLDENKEAIGIAVVEQADCGLGHIIHRGFSLLVAINLEAHVGGTEESQKLAALRSLKLLLSRNIQIAFFHKRCDQIYLIAAAASRLALRQKLFLASSQEEIRFQFQVTT